MTRTDRNNSADNLDIFPLLFSSVSNGTEKFMRVSVRATRGGNAHLLQDTEVERTLGKVYEP